MAKRKPITKANIEKLEDLSVKLDSTRVKQKALKTEEDKLKAEIVAILGQSSLPIIDDKSEYLNLKKSPGKSLRATFPDRAPKVDWELLRTKLGDEIFHEVCRVSNATLNKPIWDYMVLLERVTDSTLGECILPSDDTVP